MVKCPNSVVKPLEIRNCWKGSYQCLSTLIPLTEFLEQAEPIVVSAPEVQLFCMVLGTFCLQKLQYRKQRYKATTTQLKKRFSTWAYYYAHNFPGYTNNWFITMLMTLRQLKWTGGF